MDQYTVLLPTYSAGISRVLETATAEGSVLRVNVSVMKALEEIIAEQYY